MEGSDDGAQQAGLSYHPENDDDHDLGFRAPQLSSRVGISAVKKCFCHLPVLTGLNRQKVVENGKNENDPLAHFTCFLKPVNTSIRNT